MDEEKEMLVRELVAIHNIQENPLKMKSERYWRNT